MPVSWPALITVNGAGMPEVDGLYEKCEVEYCGVPQWKHANREMWIFWGADFEGGWVIGHSYNSGNGYRYQQFPDYYVAALNTRDSLAIEEVLKNPEPPGSDWQVYQTGYYPPKFVGGTHPPPTSSFVDI
jgi:hypothetical protein